MSSAATHPSSARREAYSHESLRRLVDPRSIAVIGASDKPGSFGANTLLNLKDAGYDGTVYPINPRRNEVFGWRCYREISDLPEVPDCAVVIVPSSDVLSVVQACADRKVGGVLIYSSGFAELGTDEGIAAQRRLAEIGAAGDMRILGPNCIGIANISRRLGLTFMPSVRDMPMNAGPIGIVSQSGALGLAAVARFVDIPGYAWSTATRLRRSGVWHTHRLHSYG